MKKNPDFIGIGMERAGSSWIFYMLASHPQIWVPPIKELHYFDSRDPESEEKPWRFRRHFMIRLKGKLAPFLKTPEDRPQFFKNSWLEYLEWDSRYFTGSYDHDWYRSLFADRYTKGRVCGEVTAAYSTLSEPFVRDLCENFPTTKLIISVRDPLERTKSAMLYYFRGVMGRKLEDISETELLEWLDRPLVQKRSNVSRMLELWEKHSHKDQLKLIDFNDIAREPETLINQLYMALDLDQSFRPPQKLIGEKVFSFKTGKDELPASVMDKMMALHDQERRIIIGTYPALAKYWKNT